LERGVFEASDLTIYHDINDGFHETPLAAARNRILPETIRSRHARESTWNLVYEGWLPSVHQGYLSFTNPHPRLQAAVEPPRDVQLLSAVATAFNQVCLEIHRRRTAYYWD
jgi:DNA-binding GntR family transcriptional regulator